MWSVKEINLQPHSKHPLNASRLAQARRLEFVDPFADANFSEGNDLFKSELFPFPPEPVTQGPFSNVQGTLPREEEVEQNEGKTGSRSSWSLAPISTALRKVKEVWESYSPKRETRPLQPQVQVPKLILDKRAKRPKRRPVRVKLNKVMACRNLKNEEKAIVERLEKGFSSNTSRKSKESRRKTIEAILDNGEVTKDIFPITPHKVKLLGGVLKESGYKAAHLYLGELKLMAIEHGQIWSDLLERTLKLSKMAVNRASGPKKKAPEVPVQEDQGDFTNVGGPRTDKLKVNLAKELFEFGVIWMLREVELSQLLSEHIALNPDKKLVSLTLPVSKTDQKGKGTLRVLQCLCKNSCVASCPYRVTRNLTEGMQRLGCDSPFEDQRGQEGYEIPDRQRLATAVRWRSDRAFRSPHRCLTVHQAPMAFGSSSIPRPLEIECDLWLCVGSAGVPPSQQQLHLQRQERGEGHRLSQLGPADENRGDPRTPFCGDCCNEGKPSSCTSNLGRRSRSHETARTSQRRQVAHLRTS